MSSRLIKAHRFLLSQSFYPIVLSTVLALAIFAVRIYRSDSQIIFRNLVWNLFLAWIPYLFAVAAAIVYRWTPRRAWLWLIPLGVLWLVFFPNAPYIVTDFTHLQERPSIPLWYDIMLLSTFAWTGIFLAIASLRTMHWLVSHYLGRWLGWLFAATALVLSGLGIYLGRFERWNTWDLIFHPRRIAMDLAVRIANPLENMRFVGFTVLFTAFLAVIYFMFISARRMDEVDDQLE